MRKVCKTVAMLCCAVSVACHPQAKTGGPEPGMELYAVAGDSVAEVLVSLPTHKVYAYRWGVDQPFHLVIASREDAAAEQCAGGGGFERLLEALARMPVVKESEKHFDDRTAAWAEVRLLDTTNLEPIEARIRIPESNAEPVVIQFRDRQYVVRVDSAALQTAKSGCDVLGRAQ